MSESQPPSDSVAYLLNGLPSLLARRVLEQVLCFEPRARVFAIVHADDVDYVERTLMELEPAQQSRIELLTGDLTAIDFGLSGAEYLSLAQQVRRVHHVVTPSAIYADVANADAVGAALGREIVEFGRAASGLRAFVVYSSAEVNGDRSGTVLEEELEAGQAFPRPFARALALMERIVRGARDQLPAVVVRPTLLAGDSQTGECERTTPLYQLIEAVLSVPTTQVVRVPRDRAPLHLVAVDYVARAAYYAGRRQDTIGSTLHLTDTHPTTIEHLLDLVLDACGHERREKHSLGSRLQQPISDLSRACAALRGPHVFYDTRQMDRLLGQSGISCPPLGEYADKLVHFVQGRRKRHA